MLMSFSIHFLFSLLLFSSASYVFVSLFSFDLFARIACSAFIVFFFDCLFPSMLHFSLFYDILFFLSSSSHLIHRIVLCPSILLRAFSPFFLHLSAVFALHLPRILLLFSISSSLHLFRRQPAAGSRLQVAGSRLSRIPPVSL